MEFYQKLQMLRKQSGMSQEELASILNVSRQAVSKWENGQGYPETEKLMQLSNLFNVTLDYLLKTEPATGDNDTPVEKGFYANRETLDGFLSYRQKGSYRIAVGVAILILSIIFPFYWENNDAVGVTGMLITAAFGVFILVSMAFRNNIYQDVEKQPLVFDPAVFNAIKARSVLEKRKNGILISCGIVLIIIGVIFVLLSDPEMMVLNSKFVVLFPLFTSIGVASIIIGGSRIIAFNLLVKNEDHIKELTEDSKYGWIWGVLDRKSVV